MALYRVKQFYWAVTSKVSSEDEIFIKKYLSKVEFNLFQKLPYYEKAHAFKVAKDVSVECSEKEENKNMLIKAALLHDIGKISGTLTPIDKSFLVVMDKISNGGLKKFCNIKKIDIYYNHADIGYNLLKRYGYDERFLYLIKNHHNSNIIGDKELNILKMCDSRN